MTEPDKKALDERRRTGWEPIIGCLADELPRLRATHGIALLLRAHSIKSELHRFFSGRLPHLRTAGGARPDPELASRLSALSASHNECTSVIDGRFKGGSITRHYGQPAAGIHTVQLETSQRIYTHEEPPHRFDKNRAVAPRPLLRWFVVTMLARADDARP